MIRRILFLSAVALASACSREVPVVDPAARQREKPWSKEVVEAARAIPVQHEGRVKPLDTLASFTLYALHGRRDMKFCWGEQQEKVELTPTEWLLDVFFYPDQAARYPLFRIDNSEVLRALWPNEAHGQKMTLEFLSYEKLLPVGDDLLRMASDLEARKELKAMEPGEQAIVALRDRLWTYHMLHQQFHLLHSPYLIKGEKLLAMFGGRDHSGLAEVLRHGREIALLAREVVALPMEQAGTAPAIAQELSQLAAESDRGAGYFPPRGSAKEQEKWWTLGDLARQSLDGKIEDGQLDRLALIEQAATAGTQEQREQAVLAWARSNREGAEARGEFAKVQLESDYYAWSLAYHALHWFLSGFAFVALGWLFLRIRWAGRLLALAAFGFTAVGLGYLTWDLVLRCMITGRPPIKNLYDTFLFIAAVGVLAGLVTELVTRRKIALSVSPILGALLIMLARAYETMDGTDTMRQLQAVLDSNYWLATHVTTINIGYSAGMLGMMLANVWLVLRAFRVWDSKPDAQKSIVRMVYGVTCFGLLFSVVGTILGGVWANDSWGRFWGWDPKENGALLICLAQAALLHGRMSGLVRDFGFCLGAAATGIVVAFSWFHVNLLGVGLHSYGFSSDLKRLLVAFYLTEAGIMFVGIIGQWLRALLPSPAARQLPAGSD
ncbi:MAG: hypothetical protein Fur0037_22840 [Planctomycetota bacterium]